MSWYSGGTETHHVPAPSVSAATLDGVDVGAQHRIGDHDAPRVVSPLRSRVLSCQVWLRPVQGVVVGVASRPLVAMQGIMAYSGGDRPYTP